MPQAHKLLKLNTLDETPEDDEDVDPDHFVESQQMMDGQQLLQKIKDPVKMSEWKRVEFENGNKKISYVTQDVPT